MSFGFIKQHGQFIIVDLYGVLDLLVFGESLVHMVAVLYEVLVHIVVLVCLSLQLGDLLDQLFPAFAQFTHSLTGDDWHVRVVLETTCAIVLLAIVTFRVAGAIESCLETRLADAVRHVLFLEVVCYMGFLRNNLLLLLHLLLPELKLLSNIWSLSTKWLLIMLLSSHIY